MIRRRGKFVSKSHHRLCHPSSCDCEILLDDLDQSSSSEDIESASNKRDGTTASTTQKHQ